jgi:hypothetical protein
MVPAPSHSRTKSRSGSETRKRKPIVGFRASEAELAEIQKYADRAGLTVSSYLRSRALAKPTTRAVRRPPVATAQLARLLGLLGSAGGALQRIAQRLHDRETTTAEEIATAIADFRATASAILQTLGKRAHDY